MRYCHCLIPFILLLFAPFLSNAQDHALKIEPTEIDYGETEEWLSRIDTINLINTSDQPVSILKRKPPAHTQIEWPEDAIQPGARAIIRIVYAPKSRGPFNVEIPVYYSSAAQPVTIDLKGEVVSFADNAFKACPTLGKDKDEVSFLHRGIVVDSLTGKPIEEATVTISEVSEDKITNEEGVYEKQIPIGRYTITASAEYYGSKDTTVYLNRNNPFLRFELPRDKELAAANEIDEKQVEELDNEGEPSQPEAQPGNPPVPPGRKDTVEQQPEEDLEEEPDEAIASDDPDDKDTVLLPVSKYKPNNVVFLIDVSTSMDEEDKLPYLKKSINNMVRHLRSIDKVTIVSYATVSHMVLSTTTADNKVKIEEKVNALEARGSTKANKGLTQAYQKARKAYIKDGNNQVIIASDGKFDELSDSRTKINMKVRWNAFRGINLSIVGFGQDREALEFMKGMAKKGNGSTLLIQDQKQAEKALLQEIKENARRAETSKTRQ